MRLPVIALALAASACANTSKPLEPVLWNASLPYPAFGTLQAWTLVGDGSLALQAQDKTWHRATFTAPCAGLKVAPPVLAIKVSRFGETDRVSGVTIGAETCYFKTLETVDDPKSLAIAAPSAPVEGRPLPAPSR